MSSSLACRAALTRLQVLVLALRLAGCATSTPSLELQREMLRELHAENVGDRAQGDAWAREVAGLAHGLGERLRGGARTLRVAVLDFTTSEGALCGLGGPLAEELTTSLFDDERFSIIERRMLDRVLTEAQLSQSDFFDLSHVAHLGRLLGADALVTGTITATEETYSVHARIIRVESGEVASVAKAVLTRHDAELRGTCRGHLLGAEPAREPQRAAAPAPRAGRPRHAPRHGAGHVFLDVSPAGRELGDLLEQYGNDLSVVRSGGKLVIGAQVPGGKTLRAAADFPEDFRLRVSSILECGALDAITFVDEGGHPLRVDAGPPGLCWSSMTITLPGGAHGDTPYRVGEVKENEIELVKKGSTLKVLINNYLIVSAKVPDGLGLLREVRIDWGHKWKEAPAMFARIVGEEL